MRENCVFVFNLLVSQVLVERGVVETPSPARVSPSARRIFRLSIAPCAGPCTRLVFSQKV